MHSASCKLSKCGSKSDWLVLSRALVLQQDLFLRSEKTGILIFDVTTSCNVFLFIKNQNWRTCPRSKRSISYYQFLIVKFCIYDYVILCLVWPTNNMLTNKNASMQEVVISVLLWGTIQSLTFSQKAFVYVEATSPRIRYQIKPPSKVCPKLGMFLSLIWNIHTCIAHVSWFDKYSQLKCFWSLVILIKEP